MESNRDEAERCIKIANDALIEGKFEKAEKFLNKSEKLYPSVTAKNLLSKVRSIIQQKGYKPKASTNERQASPKRDTKPAEPEYTKFQLEAVTRIKKCKDYYEVLEVTKEATDSDIKKAYKKLALLLHPDKNKAPGSVEAFKAIGNAVAVLTDPEKRKSYDLHGNDDIDNRRSYRQRTSEFTYTRGFEADLSAEELFNMFFGTGFPPQNYYTRQRRFHRAENHNQRESPQSNYGALINFLPILFLIGVSMMSSLFISEPLYSLAYSSKYPIERYTKNLQIPYFVKDSFSLEYQGSLYRLEAVIEKDFEDSLRRACTNEQLLKESLLMKGRSFNNQEAIKKAQSMHMEACDRLRILKRKRLVERNEL